MSVLNRTKWLYIRTVREARWKECNRRIAVGKSWIWARRGGIQYIPIVAIDFDVSTPVRWRDLRLWGGGDDGIGALIVSRECWVVCISIFVVFFFCLVAAGGHDEGGDGLWIACWMPLRWVTLSLNALGGEEVSNMSSISQSDGKFGDDCMIDNWIWFSRSLVGRAVTKRN